MDMGPEWRLVFEGVQQGEDVQLSFFELEELSTEEREDLTLILYLD